MQKTTLFGKSQPDNTNIHSNEKVVCQSCLKFQEQLEDMNVLLSQKQEQIQNLINGSSNQSIQMVQQELVSLNQKYSSLKKKVKQIQKESDDLFAENTLLEKQLNAYKSQLKQQSVTIKHKPHQIKSEQSQRQTDNKQNQIKQLQVQLFVSQQKVKQLQTISNNQNEQIIKLKQFIKKRNRLQEERHKIISSFA